MMHDLLCALPDWLIGHILVGTTRPRRRQESALYFNANTDAILLLVVLNALFANWGGGGATAATWGTTVLDDSSESEGTSEGAAFLGQADPSAK
jgi:hypothetical protein